MSKQAQVATTKGATTKATTKGAKDVLVAPAAAKAQTASKPAAVKPAPAETPKATSPFAGEQHGIKPPVRAGKCMDVWLKCAELASSAGADGKLPTVAEVQAAMPEGTNATNTQIEVYRWRKWNGIRGRQAKAAEPEAK